MKPWLLAGVLVGTGGFVVRGFGVHSRLHTAMILRLSTDLPLVVEIADTRENFDAFPPVVDAAVREGLATIEKVDIRFYRSGEDGTDSG